MKNNQILFTLLIVFIFIELINGAKEEVLSSKTKCYSCNGSNPKCSQDPNDVDYVKCYDIKQCYTWTGNGLNFRGCYVENTWPCINATDCELCNGKYCNNRIVPSNRLKCYYCTGKDCTKLNKKLELPCLEHKEDNNCFTFRDDKTKLIIERGCVSLSASYNPCLTNKDNCKTCDTESCNIHNDWEISPTSTLSTEKTSEETTESINTSEITSEASDISTPKPISFSCYKCRSDFIPACVNSNLDLMHGRCRENITEKTKGCYTDVHDDGVVYRGCLADILDNKILERCISEDYSKCVTCYEENCNHGTPFASGSIGHEISYSILILLILICLKLQK